MAAAAVAAAGSSNVEFIRARSDKREYRRVVLANALEILLISDPDTDKSKSMDVPFVTRRVLSVGSNN
ncbi:Insulin-degrading enzyme-like 2 [Zea mays]|uniref:Insulin-degrading enzyme-like 2 n=1 Tax=Zea mays TaxID=4577 RepID=A0A3L6FF77_MAIZE|nr:Insulin-degrading enzyme-like 2 [Zea mays]